ncbi:MAG: hypothetical protein M1834_005072 [Cirrosporium novae-zelandiae]|nr:MAG: hypothetical protein M1834_005072 [Cirrosporium novae-zelandiae]
MAPSDSSDRSSDHSQNNTQNNTQHENNPFIAFRRYADEQISSFLQSIVGLPSTLVPPPRDSRFLRSPDQPKDQQQNEQDKYWDPWEDFNRQLGNVYNSPESVGNSSEQHARAQRSQDQDQEAVIPVKKWYERDPEERKRPPFPFGHHHFHHHDHFRSFFEDGFSGFFQNSSRNFNDSPAWTVPFIIFSPYSPLFLERQPGFRDFGYKWRDAFEDLMGAVEGGNGMVDPETRRQETTPRGLNRFQDGSLWIGRMMERGSLGNWKTVEPDSTQENSRPRHSNRPWGCHKHWEKQWGCHKRSSRTKEEERPNSSQGQLPPPWKEDEQYDYDDGISTRQPENDRIEDEANSSPQTELDAYEHMLGNQQQEQEQQQQQQLALPPKPTAEPSSDPTKTPSIISTLTTTERTVMPDGSVHTKIVLKKRFADGREESSETVHTSHASDGVSLQQQQLQQQQTPSQAVGKRDPQDRETPKGKKGWFWS